MGVPVLELRVDNPEPGTGGWCLFDGDGWRSGRWGGRSLECIAMTSAPKVWSREFADRRDREPAAAHGSDDQAIEAIQREALPLDAALFRDHRRRAEALAATVLAERQDDVRTLARKLQRHGGWVRGVGWGLPPRQTPRPASREVGQREETRVVVRPSQDPLMPSLRAVVADSLTRSAADEQRRQEFMLDVRDRVAKRLITTDEAYRLCRQAGYRTEFRKAG
ncbi:hypothetical protein ACFFOU_14100 [Pseudonocardia sulfidoxydans]